MSSTGDEEQADVSCAIHRDALDNKEFVKPVEVPDDFSAVKKG